MLEQVAYVQIESAEIARVIHGDRYRVIRYHLIELIRREAGEAVNVAISVNGHSVMYLVPGFGCCHEIIFKFVECQVEEEVLSEFPRVAVCVFPRHTCVLFPVVTNSLVKTRKRQSLA